MNKKSAQSILLLTGSIFALLLAFLAGGLSYRAGTLTKIKKVFIPDPQPTLPPTAIQPNFEFGFLDDPLPASLNQDLSKILITHLTLLSLVIFTGNLEMMNSIQHSPCLLILHY